ncbi:MAG: branched-chain amino acid ABC transporter permease [Candidatus Firestonebacteria bacterium]
MKKYGQKVKIIVVLAAVFIFPLLTNSYWTHIATLAGVYIILSLGLNIILGFCGILMLGYAALYGIGAYFAALASTNLHLSFWLTLPISFLATLFFSVLAGAPAIRLKGDYLAIVTLGFGEIIRLLFNNLDVVTNGPKGIRGIAHPEFFSFKFSSPTHFYYLVLFFVLAIAFFVYKLKKSKIGKAWFAIKEDEIAAQSCGIDTTYMKFLAFAIGGGIAGIAGCFYAHWIGFISPESFTFYESVLIVSMVVLGGMGNIKGCIISAIILSLLPEVLRGFQSYRMLIFGALLVLIMIFKPEGLILKKK